MGALNLILAKLEPGATTLGELSVNENYIFWDKD